MGILLETNGRKKSEMVQKNWDKFLNAETMRNNLTLASLFLTAFELLRGTIIDRIKSFFAQDYKDGKPVPSPEYQKVLSRHRSPLQASCLWLLKNDVITEGDIATVHSIRQHRNEIAHRLPNFLASAEHEIDLTLFLEIRRLLLKIERWWILEVDIPTNPDHDGEKISETDVTPGVIIALDLVIQSAVGKQATL